MESKIFIQPQPKYDVVVSNTSDIPNLIITKAKEKMEHIQKKYEECIKINAEVRDRLAKFMKVTAPFAEMEQAPLILVKQIGRASCRERVFGYV